VWGGGGKHELLSGDVTFPLAMDCTVTAGVAMGDEFGVAGNVSFRIVEETRSGL